MKKGNKAGKIVLVLTALISIVFLWLPSQSLARKKTIKVLAWAGPRCEFTVKGMAEIYMKDHPDLNIVVSAFPYGQFNSAIALDIAGGGKGYDIAWVFHPFDKGYVDAGYLRPLDKYLLEDPEYWVDLQKDISPKVLSLYQYGGHRYAMPADGTTQIFYYRKDLLSQAGVKVPTTWDEVLSTAPKLHSPPNVYAVGIYLERYWATDGWLVLFFSAGGIFWGEDHQPLLDSPAAVRATELLMSLSSYIPSEAIGWDEAKLHDSIGNAGIVAMAPNCWTGPVLTDPEMSKFADQIDVAMTPTLDGNLEPPMGGLGLGVTARSAYPDEAWQFIKFYMARENQRTVVSLGGSPARTSALTDPVNVAKNRFFPFLEKSLRLARLYPPDTEYERIAELLGIELDNMILGKKTVKEALKDANRAAYEVFVETGKIKE